MRDNLLAIKVATRYLWSRKSHTAVTAIAIAGVCGVAIATMAIVCVLSVFNGFNEVILQRDSRITPDITVTPRHGALINNADSLAAQVARVAGVKAVSPAVNDEAVAYFNGRQLPVNILGVTPDNYRSITAIDSIMIAGKWAPGADEVVRKEAAQILTDDDLTEIDDIADEEFDESALFEEEEVSASPIITDSLPVSPIIISTGTASNLQIPSDTDSGLLLFLPRRTAPETFNNPTTAFMVDSLAVTGIFSSNQPEFDAATVIMDIETARRLLEYDTQANSLLIRITPGYKTDDVKASLETKINKDYKVTDCRDEQTLHYRMMSIEKWITFLLLGFILLIASFNIISTLCMLIVEKRSNIHTFRSYGASLPFIKRIFFWESMIVCLTGSIIGIVIGVGLCLLQIHLGLITIPVDTSQMLINAYPMSINPYDLLLIFILSIGVAALTGAISGAYASRTARLHFDR